MKIKILIVFISLFGASWIHASKLKLTVWSETNEKRTTYIGFSYHDGDLYSMQSNNALEVVHPSEKLLKQLESKLKEVAVYLITQKNLKNEKKFAEIKLRMWEPDGGKVTCHYLFEDEESLKKFLKVFKKDIDMIIEKLRATQKEKKQIASNSSLPTSWS